MFCEKRHRNIIRTANSRKKESRLYFVYIQQNYKCVDHQINDQNYLQIHTVNLNKVIYKEKFHLKIKRVLNPPQTLLKMSIDTLLGILFDFAFSNHVFSIVKNSELSQQKIKWLKSLFWKENIDINFKKDKVHVFTIQK